MKREKPCEAQLRAITSKYCSSSMKDARIVHHHCNTHVYITMDNGSRLIVRICDGPYWTTKAEQTDKFVREQFAWETLKRVDGLLVPQVVAIEVEETIVPYPFIVMTCIPGTPMCDVFPTLSHSEQIHLLEELGTVARSIHALCIDPASVPNEVYRCPGHYYHLHEHLHNLTIGGCITARVRDRLERLLSDYSPLLVAMDDNTAFLHGDIHFPNVLLQHNNGQWHISGLVDAELACIGPRGIEFRSLEQNSFRQLMVPGMRDAFLRGYGEDYGREEYKLAYLTSELDPDCLNRELLEAIESACSLDSLDCITIFGSA